MAEEKQGGRRKAGWPKKSRVAEEKQGGRRKAGWPKKSRVAEGNAFGHPLATP